MQASGGTVHHREPQNGEVEPRLADEALRFGLGRAVRVLLRVGVLAIQGADDQYGTLAQIREIENRIYSPLDVEILPDCRHSPHLEQGEKTIAAIADFCARLDRIEKQVVNIR